MSSRNATQELFSKACQTAKKEDFGRVFALKCPNLAGKLSRNHGHIPEIVSKLATSLQPREYRQNDKKAWKAALSRP
jgi:hypothetical protein